MALGFLSPEASLIKIKLKQQICNLPSTQELVCVVDGFVDWVAIVNGQNLDRYRCRPTWSFYYRQVTRRHPQIEIPEKATIADRVLAAQSADILLFYQFFSRTTDFVMRIG